MAMMTPNWLHHRLAVRAGHRQRQGKSTPLSYLLSAYGVRAGWHVWRRRGGVITKEQAPKIGERR